MEAQGEKDGMQKFELRTRPDCHGTPQETQNRTWFYFGVTRATSGQTIHITMRNLNKQGKLFSQGHQPVVRVQHADRAPGRWLRACDDVSHHYSDDEEFNVEWQYTFSPRTTSDTKVFFAFCYPYSYDESQQHLEEVDRRFQYHHTMSRSHCGGLDGDHGSDGGDEDGSGPAVRDGRDSADIYYHRELLVRSLDGLRVDLITVSSTDSILDEEEPRLPTLFPDTATPRARRFRDKKVFFMSSRVHPGEVPASHVFNGFLEFILRPDDPRARALRHMFVFKLIPILNPDGVRRGHYRMDSRGVNLNRFHHAPSRDLHPSIYASRAVCLHHHSHQQLEYYIDLHAHAGKRGCFIFGNALDGARQERNVAFARLVALNSAHFDFNQCNFSERGMFSKDRNSLSKEGSGRVGVFLATNITHAYTLECNYNTGRSVNALPVITGDGGLAERTPQTPSTPPPYTIEIWEDVGRAVAIAALDLVDRNPWSRLPASEFKGLAELLKHVGALIKSSRAKKGSSPGAMPRRVAVALRNSKAVMTSRAMREMALARSADVAPGMSRRTSSDRSADADIVPRGQRRTAGVGAGDKGSMSFKCTPSSKLHASTDSSESNISARHPSDGAAAAAQAPLSDDGVVVGDASPEGSKSARWLATDRTSASDLTSVASVSSSAAHRSEQTSTVSAGCEQLVNSTSVAKSASSRVPPRRKSSSTDSRRVSLPVTGLRTRIPVATATFPLHDDAVWAQALTQRRAGSDSRGMRASSRVPRLPNVIALENATSTKASL